MDDEVDWSDGPIFVEDVRVKPTAAAPDAHTPVPLKESTLSATVDGGSIDVEDASVEPITPAPVAYTSVPLKEPTPSATADDGANQTHHGSSKRTSTYQEKQGVLVGKVLLQVRSSGDCSSAQSRISRSQRARIGVHFNRREPSRQDYANYVLYQANQKSYEAMFLKCFVNHALHPNQIGSIVSSHNDTSQIEHYLKTVLMNINQIVNKMVWNTHSRTVNFLANDGKQRAHFWDHENFDSEIFREFSPANPNPVVHNLRESWHRAWEFPPMVQYTSKDYPHGKHSSPFEEIDEVSETLFNDNCNTPPTGRAVKPPYRKKKSFNSRGAAPRTDRDSVIDRDWLHDLTAPRIAAPETNNLGLENNRYRGQVSSSKSNSDGVGPKEDINPVPDTLPDRTADTSPSCKTVTQLELLVKQHGPDVLIRGIPAPVPWRTRLINDHKRRLNEKWPDRQYHHTQDRELNIKAIIKRAVERGIIKPPNAEMQKKINIAARIEQRKKLQAASLKRKLTLDSQKAKTQKQPSKSKTGREADNAEPPLKRRKKHDHTAIERDPPLPPPPHPSGSKTLEPNQILPPMAYFEPRAEDEKPAWRCGIKHAMGHYYMAGNRKNCTGCFTSINHNPRLKYMDFYLPPGSYYHQAAPGVIWNPSKQYVKSRRCTHLSHNGIAKGAFWDAINTGASAEAARRSAVQAVEEHLRPKTPPRQPTPEPEPEPVDLGPHPSGSKTMEHGQDIPECAYWEKKERGEALAWRCDIQHALGRYYLSGNKRNCPGCGSNKTGLSKCADMDFYLPDGVVLRQEASGLVEWQPRKPYNSHSTTPKKSVGTHNQMCSKKYWEFVEAGQGHEEALLSAIAEIDAMLDARNEAIRVKQEEQEAKLERSRRMAAKKGKKKRSLLQPKVRRSHSIVSNGLLASLTSRDTGSVELSRDGLDRSMSRKAASPANAIEVPHFTSSDDSTSSSDSE